MCGKDIYKQEMARLIIISLSKVFTTTLAVFKRKMLTSSFRLTNADFSQPFCS